MIISKEFIEKIPKTDLHVHLDGSMRLSTLMELANEQGLKLPASDEEGLRRAVFKKKYTCLTEYLKGFQYVTAVLQTGEALERVAYELAQDNQAEGVRYMEVRFAPQLHQNPSQTCIDAMAAIHRGMARAKEEFNARAEVKTGAEPPFEYGIIACALRMFDYGFSHFYDTLLNVHAHSERKEIFSLASKELVLAAVEAKMKLKLPIVGFDLAGAEAGFPAEDHAQAYSLAHKNFLYKTVHAGEAYGPESIFQAITDLHADRIGHGVYLFDADMIKSPEIKDKKAYVANLVQFIADRRITIEVCLTSNLQTNPAIRDLTQHSFGQMREAKLSATFCTDNRTVSQTTVSAEILKAVQAFGITPRELKNFIIYGFKRSFYPGTYIKKREYVHQIIEYYEKIEEQYR
jgi:adenosine deaminase